MVFGSTFLVRFAFGVTISVFASYISGSSVGIDTADVGTIGLLGAMAPVGEFSTVLLTGGLADRRGRFPVLLGAIGAAAVMMFLFTLSRNWIWLGGLNLLFGVASGAILTTSLALVGDEAGAEERGYEMGRFDSVNLLGWILGFAVGFGFLGLLPNATLGRIFDLGAAVLAGGFGLGFLALRGMDEPVGGHRWIGFEELLRTAFRREVLLVTLPWLVIYLLLGTLFVFLGTASTGAGIPAGELSLLIGVGGLLLLLTQPYFGRLADRYGRTRLMIVGTIGFVGVLAGAGLLATFGPVPILLGFVGVSTLAALAYGPAALAALTDASRSFSRATTMSVYTLSISLGMLGGLVLSTALFGRYGPAGLDVYFGGIAVALVVLTTIRYRDGVRAADAGPAVPVATRPPAQ
ncbi:MAG: MFS transporter [Thermoplasmata archaeon]|nr:MFS transporter [Thermoplasmata archaeon]